MAHGDTDKFCVHWQGRKVYGSPGRGHSVRQHGVFHRCTTSLDKAVQSMREVSRRRGSSSLTLQNQYGGGFTLMSCRKGRCRATHFGRKLGLKK